MVNTLENYIVELKSTLKENIKGTIDLDEESVHDFRVCMKKLRTMLNFIHYWRNQDSGKIDIYRQLRPIFKLTGKIRELQVHSELLPELAEATELNIEFLHKKIKYQLNRNRAPIRRDMKVFEKSINKVFVRIKNEIKTSSDAKLRSDAPAGFQIRLEKKIQKQLQFETPNLHLIRRAIKQKVYVFDTFQESELLSFYKEFRAEWKILESSMGKWHDQVVFLEWLNKGLKWKRLSDEEYKTMLNLIAWLKSSTERMEEQLIQSVPRLKV